MFLSYWQIFGLIVGSFIAGFVAFIGLLSVVCGENEKQKDKDFQERMARGKFLASIINSDRFKGSPCKRRDD